MGNSLPPIETKMLEILKYDMKTAPDNIGMLGAWNMFCAKAEIKPDEYETGAKNLHALKLVILNTNTVTLTQTGYAAV